MYSIDMHDLENLISCSLGEHVDNTNISSKLIQQRHIKETFGTLIADIFRITDNVKHLFIQRYDIKNTNDQLVLSFIIGDTIMLFGNSFRSFREDLLRSERILGVVTLKQKVFKRSVLPKAIIILNNRDNTTWFTSAENREDILNIINGTFPENAKVYFSTIISSENLLPEYYNGADQAIGESLKGSEAKELSEVATIIAGKGAMSEDFAEQGIPYLRARDIKDGKIILPNVFIREDKIERFSKQLLQDGDILLTKNFGQNKLALMTQKDIPAIASNALYVIRPFEVSEEFLYRYLTSRTGNVIFSKQINRIQKGVTIPSITLKDLMRIIVPIFDRDTIQSIESPDSVTYEDMIRTSKRLIEKLSNNNDIESAVMESLLKAGWEKSNFLNESKSSVAFRNIEHKYVDFIYTLPDKRKVYIEVKSKLIHIKPEWFESVKQILFGDKDCLFILTTGIYYEVHSSGVEKSLKLMQAPSVEEILNWEREVR